MNVLAATAGVLTLLAFGAHAIVGAREFRQFAPPPDADAPRTAWVQALSGWHWVSVTLLAAGVLFIAIAFSDVVPSEAAVLRVLSAYFALCGMAWFATVLVVSRGGGRRFLVLGQWLFCLVVAALAYFAA